MSQHALSIAPGVIIEHVGSDVVVMVPESTEVNKLSGDAAQTIRAIQAGDVSVLPSETVSELVDRGIVVSQGGMSRRGLIKASAIGAGAGIAVMVMPSVAAASSVNIIELNGLIYGSNAWSFEIQRGEAPGLSFPEDPLPSNSLNDVSDLTVSLGGNDVVIPRVSAGFSGSFPFITWDNSLNTDPGAQVIGEFTWLGADGVLRYYRVTFRKSWS
jgi:hypothetical protein